MDQKFENIPPEWLSERIDERRVMQPFDGARALRTYRVWGKESLDDVNWTYPTNALHRFFKVTVEMP